MTIELSNEIKNNLITLADKYETKDFIKNDPSLFLYWYNDIPNIECCSLITALLSFGKREQFINKIKIILNLADKRENIVSWLKNKNYKEDFIPDSTDLNQKFYRFYSYNDLHILFHCLSEILINNGSLGDFFKKEFFNRKKNTNKNQYFIIMEIINEYFFNSKIVPKGKNSANKRINMFLRWMTRQSSPVDLGIWQWLSQEELIIPLDTHVLQQSKKIGLLPTYANSNIKTAILLTEKLKTIWPMDPCKGDFSLFGVGVNEKKDIYE